MRRSLVLAGLALALVASGCQFGDANDSDRAAVTAPPGRVARASYENGFAACRRAQNTDALHFAPAPGEDRQLHARRYLDRMRSIVRANLKAGSDFGLALGGCVEAAWPKGVAVPSRSLRTLIGGEKLSFPPGVVRARETLTCVSDSIRVKAVVPPAGRSNISHADGTNGSAEIRITTRSNGTVLAECL